MMRKVIIVLAAALMAVSCRSEAVTLTVSNPSDFDRAEELVELTVSDLNEMITLGRGQAYVVKNSRAEIVPSQVTSEGKLIFQSGLAAGACEEFTVSPGTPGEFEPKTFARYVPERKDDFAWENDRVAFRIYGPALMFIDGPSNGIDAWYKRTDKLVIDKWYADDLARVSSYHADSGEGLDDYKVGRSLGAGAMAPYVDGALVLNTNYVSWSVSDNGPLRSTFTVEYPPVEVNGVSYAERRTFIIDAGSQLTRVVQEYNAENGNRMTVAAGIVMRPENHQYINDDNYIIYRNNESEGSGDVFMSVVVPQGMIPAVNSYNITRPNGAKDEFTHVLAVTEYTGSPVTYYTGYGWTKYGFPTQDDYRRYIENFVASLDKPLQIKYNRP